MDNLLSPTPNQPKRRCHKLRVGDRCPVCRRKVDAKTLRERKKIRSKEMRAAKLRKQKTDGK